MSPNPYYNGPVSDHFDGSRFFTPGEPIAHRSLGAVLRWRWEARHNRARWPTQVNVQQAVPEARVPGLRATPIGHSSVLLQIDGRNVLTDPVWSDRAGPLRGLGPRRVARPGIALADLPPVDVVLLSHNHYDHFDVATLRRLQSAHAPVFVTPLGNDTLLRRKVGGARVLCGDWGDRFDLSGLTIDIVPAKHWSARGIRDRRAALWGGFVVRGTAHGVYYAGDTGIGDGTMFSRIGDAYRALDLALIPIGAYLPRSFMQNAHINPTEAVALFQHCGARRALGVHWGTFRLSDEAYDAPVHDLRAALAQAGIAQDRFTPAYAGVAEQISAS